MFSRTGCQFGVPGSTYPPKKYPSAPPPRVWSLLKLSSLFFKRLRSRFSSLFFAASSPQKLTFWLELTNRYPKIHEVSFHTADLFWPHNGERLWVLSRFEHGYQASTWRTNWLEIDGKSLRCNLKCTVVLVTQIRRHFKAVRDLFLKISDHGLKTQDFHHNHILMLIGTSVQDNLILLQCICRGLLAW